MRLPLTITLLIAFVNFSIAQSGIIKGTVIDGINNEPIPFANIC